MNLLKRITYKLIGAYIRVGEYVSQLTKKNALVLHFTAGYGDALGVARYFDCLKGHVATAYACGRDGVIAELFPPAYWAYHLGSTLYNEMRTIGIEIVNIGPLWERGGLLYDAYGNIYRGDYITLKVPYKGVFHWAKFTEEQYENVGKWAAERCVAFGIPPVIHTTLEFDANNSNLTGILNHAQFRQDKYDIGPAWDFAKFKTYFDAEYKRLTGAAE